MHPLLLIGFAIVAVGVFAEAAEKPATKVIKIAAKKPAKENEKKPEEKPAGASDSEE